jgi:hypothetical protein
VVFVETPDHLALVDLVAFLHQRGERVRRQCTDRLGNIERRKPQIGYIAEIAAAEEAAGLQIAQPVAVAGLEEERAIQIVRLLCRFLARDLVMPVLRKKRQVLARRFGADAFAV